MQQRECVVADEGRAVVSPDVVVSRASATALVAQADGGALSSASRAALSGFIGRKVSIARFAAVAEELADRYLALWNEPDVDRRRRMIAELWTEDGRHFLQPPQEIRGIAAQPGIG